MAETYITPHRNLAAFLLARGYELLSHQDLGGGFVEFTFAADAQTPQVVEGFYNGEGAISAQRFINCLDQVRAIIREAKRGATLESGGKADDRTS